MTTPAKLNFETELQAFKASNQKAVEHALNCSHLAIVHFYEHGDTAYIQRFHDALVKNWNRVAALKLWLRDYAPLSFTKEKFALSAERKAEMWPDDATKAALLAEALAKPFWEMKPDTEQVAFDFNKNLIAMFKHAIARARNEKLYTEESRAANAEKVAQAERMVVALETGKIASIVPAKKVA